MSCFGTMTSFVTPFCPISLILPLHRLLEQPHLIFPKYLLQVKLFNITEEHFGKILFWYHVLLLTHDVICDVSLLLFQLNLNFTKYLWGVKLFNMTRGTILKKNSMPRLFSRHFDVTSFCYISLILPLEQLNLIFTKCL